MSNSMRQIFMSIMTLLLVGAFSMTSAQQRMPMPGGAGQQQEVKTDFTKAELKKFIRVNKEVGRVQQKNQQKMMKAIKDEGVEVQRFNEILTGMQQGKQAADMEASSEEMNSVNKAAKKVMDIRKGTQKKIQKTIKEEGMDPQKYQDIMLAYQKSDEVKSQINGMLEASPGQGQQ